MQLLISCSVAGLLYITSTLPLDISTQTLFTPSIFSSEFLICVLNFTPVVHYDYNVGVPYLGEYEEIFNSDDEKYWGSNQTMKKDTLHAIDEKWHNKPYHIRIKVPPLGATFIKMKKKI